MLRFSRQSVLLRYVETFGCINYYSLLVALICCILLRCLVQCLPILVVECLALLVFRGVAGAGRNGAKESAAICESAAARSYPIAITKLNFAVAGSIFIVDSESMGYHQ